MTQFLHTERMTMTKENSAQLIERYYAAFNAQDTPAMLDCLAEVFVHEVSQGKPRKGKEKFEAFLNHMHQCYLEKLRNIKVMISDDGTRAAAEFDLEGTYLKTDKGLPEANGQTYTLRVGAFFEIKNDRITRVSTHYNLADWTRQVLGE